MSPTPPDMDSRNHIDDVDNVRSGGGRNIEEEVMPRVQEQSDRATSRNSTPRSFKQPAISTLSGKYKTNKHNDNSINVTPKFERQNRLVSMNLTPNLGLSMTPSTSLFAQQKARHEAIQSLTTSKDLEQRSRRRSLWSRNNSLERELLRTEKDKFETAAALHKRKEEDLKRSMVKELQERREREIELVKSIELLKEIHQARKIKEQDLQDQIVDLQEIVNELSIQNQSPDWMKVSSKSNTKQSSSTQNTQPQKKQSKN